MAQSSSVAAQMTSALWRRHAWVVTGTPITSRVDEIQARCTPCHLLRASSVLEPLWIPCFAEAFIAEVVLRMCLR